MMRLWLIVARSDHMTSLEKRLIAAMDCGITIQHMNGHRYIVCTDYERNFEEVLTNHNVNFNGKVYGSLIDALNYIDFLRKKCGLDTLEEMYDEYERPKGNHLIPYYDKMNILVQHEDEVEWERRISYQRTFDPHYLK